MSLRRSAQLAARHRGPDSAAATLGKVILLIVLGASLGLAIRSCMGGPHGKVIEPKGEAR